MVNEFPPCPARLLKTPLGPTISGLWDYAIPSVCRNNYTNTDLLLLGEYCRVMASADANWHKSEGQECMFNPRSGAPLMNPHTKAYFECVAVARQLARQLGMSLREHQLLERGKLAITFLEQKLIAGIETNELGEFEKSLATSGEDW